MNTPSIFKWRRTTTVVLVVGLVALAVGLVASFVTNNFVPKVQVQLGNGTYYVRVAETDTDRQRGLSGATALGRNDGLLMSFERDATWGIWMKDMNIPIDIIWLDAGKGVVYIVKNAAPELSTTQTFQPKKPARYVLELAAGSVDRSGIKIDSVAAFDETDRKVHW